MSEFKEGDRIYVTKRGGPWQGREGTVLNNVSEDDEENVRVLMDYNDEGQIIVWYPTEVQVFDPAPQRRKTREQMQEQVKGLFGPNACVRYSDDQWVIETGVEEFFDPEQHKDRAAYKALMEPESSYGSALERWAHKNGHGSESMAELFDSYDEEQEQSARKAVADVRRWIALGREFDWAGGPEWRDEVLAYAEKMGW